MLLLTFFLSVTTAEEIAEQPKCWSEQVFKDYKCLQVYAFFVAEV